MGSSGSGMKCLNAFSARIKIVNIKTLQTTFCQGWNNERILSFIFPLVFLELIHYAQIAA
jgi:hypothetical protein